MKNCWTHGDERFFGTVTPTLRFQQRTNRMAGALEDGALHRITLP